MSVGSLNIITDGLVFCVDAGNDKSYSGGDWYDLSSNFNNGVLTNGPTFDPSKVGSISFDGVDDYVDFGSVSSLQFANNDAYTISIWFKWTSTTSVYCALFSYAVNGGRGYYIYLDGWYLGTDLFFSDYYDGISYRGIQTSNYSFLRNVWNNIVVTCDASNSSNGMIFYLNGRLLTSSPRAGISTPSSINYSGLNARAGIRQTTDPFEGKIASVAVWNRNLSATEILHNYNKLKWRFL